jgi:DNA-binding NarL/FixJ family response regulator
MGRRAAANQNGGMQYVRPTQVYIVEDSAAIRVRLSEMLARMEGVAVIGEAAGAQAAIPAILRLRPDSVLLDLKLDGSNGLEVLRAVHPRAPEIAFVVLTNQAEPQYRRACSAAGARYFLDKTREFERVAEVLTEIASARH